MKTLQLPSLIALTSILAAPVMAAQADDKTADSFAPVSFDRVTVSYRAGFNIKASINNLGQFPLSSPGAATAGAPHTYNNGYVLLDSSGNADGQTWNWGYDTPSQVIGGNVVMSSSLPGNIAHDVDADPQHGFELSYLRQVGVLGKNPWGIEMAFNYTDVGLHNSATLTGGPIIVDAYGLGGITSDGLPYAGSADVPGPMIGDVPTRVPVNVASRFDASVYGFRLGPFLEVPFHPRASVLFSAGLALAAVDGDFEYRQTAAVPGGEIPPQSGRDGGSDLLPGMYLAASLLYHVSDSVALSAGLQYQNVGTFTQSAGDKQVKLDLGTSVFLTAGLVFAF